MPDIRYPMYIPSKGRADQCFTGTMLDNADVPFRLVIEKEEYGDYAALWGEDRLLVLPFSDMGSVVPARNWIKQHAIDEGHAKHWQFDDNIRRMMRLYGGKRLNCRADIAIAVLEDFADRYENVAIAGFQYSMFAPETNRHKPFTLNQHVYSASLMDHSADFWWRGIYNEDTDMCLQALSSGEWCTILLTAFLADKIWTMQMSGGNTEEHYKYQDGRLKMSRELERRWPGVVTTSRRFQRPQHVVKDSWRRFDTPLVKKEGLEIPTEPNEYGMTLKEHSAVRSDRLKRIVEQYND